jgi:hypothetical protein
MQFSIPAGLRVSIRTLACLGMLLAAFCRVAAAAGLSVPVLPLPAETVVASFGNVLEAADAPSMEAVAALAETEDESGDGDTLVPESPSGPALSLRFGFSVPQPTLRPGLRPQPADPPPRAL